MSRELVNKAASIVSLNGVTAGINLLTTVLLVRWFGTATYADYTVTLALVSVSIIVLEIIPSSFSVFWVQDDPILLRGLAAVSLVSSVVLAMAVGIGAYLTHWSHGFSVWILVYASSMAMKRYLDIRLQSSGRLHEFFQIELSLAAARLALMGLFLALAWNAPDAVWGSLALGTLLAQTFWFARHKEELEPFRHARSRTAWDPIIANRRRYVPYYFGIALKRVKDNAIPLLASVFFQSKDAAGVFFLAYRGLVVTLGQVRVMEGIVNHRRALERVTRLSKSQFVVIASLGQILCLGLSFLLTLTSGVTTISLATLALLSAIVWFNVLFTLQRAREYSRYHLASVNSSMITYVATAAILVWALHKAGVTAAVGFAAILLISEAAALVALTGLAKKQV